MEISGNEIKQNENVKYCCLICNYNTSRKSNLKTHLNSIRHKCLIGNSFKQQLSKFKCEICQKIYMTNAGLWKHKSKGVCLSKLCINNNIVNSNVVKNDIITKNNVTNDVVTNIDILDKNLITILLKQNTELMEILKNGTNNTNITNTNSNNKAFNLNFFLNETCKDAININDFVDSIKLQLSDLEKVGELGYIEGISNIIIKNLNALDETKRPVHCTDKKRETIYIKEQGQWEKEDENKTRLKKAINKIAHKNIKLITQFREKYPECKKSESRLSDKYNKMVIEAMGGPGDNTLEKEEKIIRNISKAILIQK
jgi:hypothetical protein